MVARNVLIGRSSRCDLRLEDGKVSTVHASLEWEEGGWRLRDLNSKNGTWLDGRRLGTTEGVVDLGAEISFGSEAETWILHDDSPTEAFVNCGFEDQVFDGDMLALPDSDRPLVTVYRRQDGKWFAESAQGRRELSDGDSLEVDGRSWRLHLPEVLPPTRGSQAQSDLLVSKLVLSCETNSKAHPKTKIIETRIEVRAKIVDQHGRTFDLGSRAHHRLLLELARIRGIHSRRGKSEDDCGWLSRTTLVDWLEMGDAGHLNVQIFRARRQLARLGFANAERIVEPSDEVGMVRLGVVEFEISGA